MQAEQQDVDLELANFLCAEQMCEEAPCAPNAEQGIDEGKTKCADPACPTAQVCEVGCDDTRMDVLRYVVAQEKLRQFRPNPRYIETVQKNGMEEYMRAYVMDWNIEARLGFVGVCPCRWDSCYVPTRNLPCPRPLRSWWRKCT